MAGSDRPKVGGLLLAAGGSSRFGSPKQLAEFDGKTLVASAAESLIGGGCDPVVAVLGSSSDAVEFALKGIPVLIANNPSWEAGLSTSIVTGMMALLAEAPNLDAVMIALADQPCVTQHTIRQFLLKYSGERKSIISSLYDGVCGVPALFGSELFDKLKQLTGDKGARHIIRDAPTEIIDSIAVGEAAIDIDTAADLRRFVDLHNS